MSEFYYANLFDPEDSIWATSKRVVSFQEPDAFDDYDLRFLVRFESDRVRIIRFVGCWELSRFYHKLTPSSFIRLMILITSFAYRDPQMTAKLEHWPADVLGGIPVGSIPFECYVKRPQGEEAF